MLFHEHFCLTIVMKHIIHFISFAQYTLFFQWIITQIHLTVSGTMEPVKAKKFESVIFWWRLEEGSFFMVNNISENVSSIGFGVELSKLHV